MKPVKSAMNQGIGTQEKSHQADPKDDDLSVGDFQKWSTSRTRNCCFQNRVYFIVLGVILSFSVVGVIIYFAVDALTKETPSAIDTLSRARNEVTATSAAKITTTAPAAITTTIVTTKKFSDVSDRLRMAPPGRDNIPEFQQELSSTVQTTSTKGIMNRQDLLRGVVPATSTTGIMNRQDLLRGVVPATSTTAIMNRQDLLRGVVPLIAVTENQNGLSSTGATTRVNQTAEDWYKSAGNETSLAGHDASSTLYSEYNGGSHATKEVAYAKNKSSEESYPGTLAGVSVVNSYISTNNGMFQTTSSP